VFEVPRRVIEIVSNWSMRAEMVGAGGMRVARRMSQNGTSGASEVRRSKGSMRRREGWFGRRKCIYLFFYLTK
jgi:hypothetical protein